MSDFTGGRHKPRHHHHYKKHEEEKGDIKNWEDLRNKLFEKENGPTGYPHSASSSSSIETTDWDEIKEYYAQFHPHNKKKNEE